MVKKRQPKIDLRKVFLGLQKEMALKLGNTRTIIGHPVAKGDVTENSWRAMLQDYLPKRYAVQKAFIVDSEGYVSDQIDLVIFDRHFSPFLFYEKDACYIPAESVYAVFEIKQEISKEQILYAGRKAESVRKLKRTSTHITHAGGRHDPVIPKDILAGILCLGSTWKSGLSKEFSKLATDLSTQQHLNLVCVLEHGAASLTRDANGVNISLYPPEQALIQFFLLLLAKLQIIGTVPAMDINAYAKSLFT